MRLRGRSRLAVVLWPLILGGITNASLARTQQAKAKSATSPKTAPLLVDTDDVCHFFIDDQDKGQLSPDKSQKFAVELGEHILKCKNDTVPDLAWRKVVEVKDTSQVAAVVSLKALHVQYDQAVEKAQNQKMEADAVAAKQLAEAEAEEKQREAAKERLPQDMFEKLKGNWSARVTCDNSIPADNYHEIYDYTFSLGFQRLQDRTIIASYEEIEIANMSMGPVRNKPRKDDSRFEIMFTPTSTNMLVGTLQGKELQVISIDEDHIKLRFAESRLGGLPADECQGNSTIITMQR